MMKENILLFCTGSTLYPALEVLYRGHSDFSMGIAGGVCMCLINRVCNQDLGKKPILIRCCAGSATITTVEFFTGLIVNIGMGRSVWDYSSLPLNLLGQICPLYSGFWALLSLPAMGICDGIFRLLSKIHLPSK
ncbi:putative ABC transporter permease [Caproicibacterium sp. NSD3]